MRPWVDAEHQTGEVPGRSGRVSSRADFLIQDLEVAASEEQGLHSLGFDKAYLAGQETRVHRFHEVLNDYIEGRR
jgi:hypothetical protein